MPATIFSFAHTTPPFTHSRNRQCRKHDCFSGPAEPEEAGAAVQLHCHLVHTIRHHRVDHGDIGRPVKSVQILSSFQLTFHTLRSPLQDNQILSCRMSDAQHRAFEVGLSDPSSGGRIQDIAEREHVLADRLGRNRRRIVGVSGAVKDQRLACCGPTTVTPTATQLHPAGPMRLPLPLNRTGNAGEVGRLKRGSQRVAWSRGGQGTEPVKARSARERGLGDCR